MKDNSIGERISSELKRNSLNQTQLAKMVGVTASAVSYWIMGKSYPTIDNLNKLAEIFAIPIRTFFPCETSIRNFLMSDVNKSMMAEALMKMLNDGVGTEWITLNDSDKISAMADLLFSAYKSEIDKIRLLDDGDATV